MAGDSLAAISALGLLGLGTLGAFGLINQGQLTLPPAETFTIDLLPATAASAIVFSEETRPIAEAIAGGHAGLPTEDGGHFEDFEEQGVFDVESLADFIEDVVDAGLAEAADASAKPLQGGRTGICDWATGTIVIINPFAPDSGTAFRPECSGKDIEVVWNSLR